MRPLCPRLRAPGVPVTSYLLQYHVNSPGTLATLEADVYYLIPLWCMPIATFIIINNMLQMNTLNNGRQGSVLERHNIERRCAYGNHYEHSVLWIGSIRLPFIYPLLQLYDQTVMIACNTGYESVYAIFQPTPTVTIHRQSFDSSHIMKYIWTNMGWIDFQWLIFSITLSSDYFCVKFNHGIWLWWHY